MNEQIEQVKQYFWVFWRRRWAAFAIMVVVCIIGWVYVGTLPDKYQSETKIYINTATVLTPLLKGLAVESEVTESAANMMRRTLLTRSNIIKVINGTDLSLRYISDEELERLVIEIINNVEISSSDGLKKASSGQENIYTIAYVDNNPVLAANVVKKLQTTFFNEILSASRIDTEITDHFLEEQIGEYEQKLIQAENDLKEFKREHATVMPAEGKSYFDRLQQAKDDLQRSELELRESLQQKQEIQSQIEQVKTSLRAARADMALSPTSALDTRIVNLQTKLDELLLNYTDNHPDIISTRRVLAGLQKQRDNELSQINDSDKPINFEKDSAYAELIVESGKANANTAALEVRVREYRKRVDELSNLINTIPNVEADLVKLNRDYEIITKKYEELVSRREAAKLSWRAERDTDETQFRIIEPARVPLVPVSPNRLLLNAGVFLAALAAGVMFPWLLMQIKPTFDNIKNLRDMFEYPVLGGVSLVKVQEKDQHMWIEVTGYAASLFLLLIILAAIILTKASL